MFRRQVAKGVLRTAFSKSASKAAHEATSRVVFATLSASGEQNAHVGAEVGLTVVGAVTVRYVGNVDTELALGSFLCPMSYIGSESSKTRRIERENQKA